MSRGRLRAAITTTGTSASGSIPGRGWQVIDVTNLYNAAVAASQNYLSLVITRASVTGKMINLTTKERDAGLNAAELWIDTVAVTEWDLTVVSGSTSGTYSDTEVVAITADAAPSGEAFDAWLGDVTDVANTASASTTITMNADATITATYAPVQLYWDGDLNTDLAVGIIDLNMVLIDWGKTGGFSDPRSDADGSGTVGIIDLNTVLIDWGKTGYQP